MTYDKPLCRNCRHWQAIDYHWGHCRLLSYTLPPDKSLWLRVLANGDQGVMTQGTFACNQWQYPLDPVEVKPPA